jgi:hypothetical protein
MTIRALSTVLTDIHAQIDAGPENVSVGTLLEGLHERGFGVAIALFTLPLSIPVPKPPGLSTIFAIPLLILTAQLAFRRHTLWFPRFILQKTFKKGQILPVFAAIIPRTRQIEVLLKPRLEIMTTGIASQMVGVVGMFISLCIMSPFVGLNTVTSIGLSIMAVGLTARDGLAIVIGAALATLWALGIISLYIFFGMEGLNALRDIL